MKQFLSFIIICGLIAVACNNTEKKPADVLAILNDSSKYTSVQWTNTSIDFGTKKMGDIVNINFICTNTGTKPLYLYDVHASCGCTLVDYSKEPVQPGNQGEIEAQFDTKKSHPGEVHKTVFVRYNTSEGSTQLKFSGIVAASDSSTTVKQ